MLKPLLLAIVLIQATIHAQAGSRCPAGNSGCTLDNAVETVRDRVKDGAEKTIKNPNERGRVREVKDTVKDCLQCASDAIKNGVDKIKK